MFKKKKGLKVETVHGRKRGRNDPRRGGGRELRKKKKTEMETRHAEEKDGYSYPEEGSESKEKKKNKLKNSIAKPQHRREEREKGNMHREL